MYYGKPANCLSYITSFHFPLTDELLGRHKTEGRDIPPPHEEYKRSHVGDGGGDRVGGNGAGGGDVHTIGYNPADLMMELLYSNAPVFSGGESEGLSRAPPPARAEGSEGRKEGSESDVAQQNCVGGTFGNASGEEAGAGGGERDRDTALLSTSYASLLGWCAPRYSLMYYYDDSWAIAEANMLTFLTVNVDVGEDAENESSEADSLDEVSDVEGQVQTINQGGRMHKIRVPFIHQVISWCFICFILSRHISHPLTSYPLAPLTTGVFAHTA